MMNVRQTPDIRSGPGTVKLPPGSAQEYIRTRFGDKTKNSGTTEESHGH